MRFRALTFILCSVATAAACSVTCCPPAGPTSPKRATARRATTARSRGKAGPTGAKLDAAKGDAEATTPPTYVHYDINQLLSTGASDAVANGTLAFITTTQPFGNLQFDTGVMTAGNCNGQGCTVYQTPAAFAPLVEGDKFFNYGVETISSADFLAAPPNQPALARLDEEVIRLLVATAWRCGPATNSSLRNPRRSTRWRRPGNPFGMGEGKSPFHTSRSEDARSCG